MGVANVKSTPPVGIPNVLGIETGELVALAGAILVGGVFTGLLAGLFGVGGGAVIVPVLYEIFRALNVPEEVRMQLCVGTSLAIIAPTSVRAFFAHRAKGVLPVEILRGWALPIVVGVLIGGLIAAVAPAWVFKLAFAIITALLAVKFLFGSGHWRLGDELPGRAGMSAYGLFIGLYSSLIGVGGGSLATIVLTLYGKPIHTAVGISTGVGVLVSVAGTFSFVLAGLPQQALLPPLSLGYVSLLGLALMAPISTLAAPYGARLAHALSKRKLETAFGIFLLLVSLRFAASLVV